jgi:hypothetical protein
MINKLILSKQNWLQLSLALFGTFFGLSMLLISVQFYQDFNGVLHNDEGDLLGDQYIVINKGVSVMNTITGHANTFSPQEIDEIAHQPQVMKVAPFTAGTFSASASLGKDNGNFPMLYTDLFFEAVPNDFIDTKGTDWNWTGGKELPVIVPADYINLYNFGFAPSQQLPQVSKNTIKLIGFKVEIKGKGQSEEYKGRIVAFSNRINTFLVPIAFMNYANNKLGHGSAPPLRLILACKDASSPELIDFLKQKGYETNDEQLKNGKLNSLLKAILAVVTLIGFVIILLSMLSTIQYSQLLVAKSDYEIKTLIRIGYYFMDIAQRYIVFYTLLYLVVSLISFGALWFAQNRLSAFLQTKGFEIDTGVSLPVVGLSAALVLSFILINAIFIIVNIRRLALPKKVD